VLVGHSIAGEELSSVGSRHPEKVAGLVYLDAGYGYAYYDRSRGFFPIDVADLQRKLEQLQGSQDSRPLIKELLGTTLPAFEKVLWDRQAFLNRLPPGMLASPPRQPISDSIIAGGQKYTKIPVPILAVFALPHDPGPVFGNNSAAREAFDAIDEVATGDQAKAFETGLPSARVVRLPHANHYLFRSNESDVLREMNAFINNLP